MLLFKILLIAYIDMTAFYILYSCSEKVSERSYNILTLKTEHLIYLSVFMLFSELEYHYNEHVK